MYKNNKKDVYIFILREVQLKIDQQKYTMTVLLSYMLPTHLQREVRIFLKQSYTRFIVS